MRRYSPSVIDFSPTPSCLRMICSISRSSTSFSASALISPRLRFSRASLSGAVRSRLPTWSARNGGLVHCISTPIFVRELHDHAQLRPLLLFGQDIAFFGRGEAALRRQAQLIERHVFGGLVDAALDVVFLFQLAGLRGDEAEHKLLLALGEEAQRLEAARAVGIVFEEITIERGMTEELLGDEFVAPRCNKR